LAIEFGDLFFVSGHLPVDPGTGAFNSADTIEDAQLGMKHLAAVDRTAGKGLLKPLRTNG
jgi:2-iminobutanoate/2-iminopropanoate deaminase